jgi:hypothetical protein
MLELELSLPEKKAEEGWVSHSEQGQSKHGH